MNEKILLDCGLSNEQSKIYLFLLENGLSPARQISIKTGVGRALTYKVLEQLIDLKLVEKRENQGKITLFAPGHPRTVQQLLEEKKQSIEHASLDLSVVIGPMISRFNALLGKPNVQSFEGIEGIKYTHEDILTVSEDILVISSPISYPERDEVISLIKNNSNIQAKHQIKTRAITPRSQIQRENINIGYDKENLIERKVIPAEKLNIPAQIVIYGDKVAITNFKESIITIIIESKYITETFKTMFEYIWNHD